MSSAAAEIKYGKLFLNSFKTYQSYFVKLIGKKGVDEKGYPTVICVSIFTF